MPVPFFSPPDQLAQNSQTAQNALTPTLTLATDTALSAPGTTFSGPIDVPEFSGEVAPTQAERDGD